MTQITLIKQTVIDVHDIEWGISVCYRCFRAMKIWTRCYWRYCNKPIIRQDNLNSTWSNALGYSIVNRGDHSPLLTKAAVVSRDFIEQQNRWREMLATVYSRYSRRLRIRLNDILLKYISAGNSKAYCCWLYPPLLSILSWTQTPECDLYPWFLRYTSLQPVKFNESGFFLMMDVTSELKECCLQWQCLFHHDYF